jgi:hypothetical protein
VPRIAAKKGLVSNCRHCRHYEEKKDISLSKRRQRRIDLPGDLQIRDADAVGIPLAERAVERFNGPAG